uniref:Uncharacterized protein n=1 Tax=Romanomermis culicivorax TaxID=13658 RepID=A0A915JBT8_ROMCU
MYVIGQTHGLARQTWFKRCMVLAGGRAPNTGHVVISNDGCAGPVVLTEIGAIGGSKVVCVNVVGMADVRPVGGSNMAVGGSNAEDDVAGSTSIGGVGGRGTLNTVFGGFFKASRHL